MCHAFRRNQWNCFFLEGQGQCVLSWNLKLQFCVYALGGRWGGEAEEEMEINSVIPGRQNNLENGNLENSHLFALVGGFFCKE